MARPQKNTATYFSHDADASASKVLTIIEKTFGLEGYALWFKLMEKLTGAENHYINTKAHDELEYLSASMGINIETMSKILDKLADLSAIDKELWVKNKVIWCQSLVDRLAFAYEKRVNTPPSKPKIVSSPENPSLSEFPPPENPIETVTSPENPLHDEFLSTEYPVHICNAHEIKQNEIKQNSTKFNTYGHSKNNSEYPVNISIDKTINNPDEQQRTLNNKDLEMAFETIWKKYPKREKRKEAFKHFRASVKNMKDFMKINKALNNYKSKLALERTESRYIQQGGTWFNNWQDYEEWKPPPRADGFLSTLEFVTDQMTKIDEMEKINGPRTNIGLIL